MLGLLHHDERMPRRFSILNTSPIHPPYHGATNPYTRSKGFPCKHSSPSLRNSQKTKLLRFYDFLHFLFLTFQHSRGSNWASPCTKTFIWVTYLHFCLIMLVLLFINLYIYTYIYSTVLSLVWLNTVLLLWICVQIHT